MPFLNWAEDKITVNWNDGMNNREDPLTYFIKKLNIQEDKDNPYKLLTQIVDYVNFIYNEENYDYYPDIKEENIFLYYDKSLEDSFYFTLHEVIDAYLSYLTDLQLKN